MAVLLLIVSISLVAPAIIIVVLGLRGSPLNTHPICRRCNFDLVGLESPANCPECGSDLGLVRAIRTGAHHRLPVVIALGLGLLLTALVIGGGSCRVLLRDVDWNTLKPDALLESQAMGPGTPNAAIIAELARRLEAGSLSAERTQRLVQHALGHQADPTQPWIRGWGIIIEVARRQGSLAAAEWDAYLGNAFPVEVTRRATLVSSDADGQINADRMWNVQVGVQLGPARLGGSGAMQYQVSIELLEITAEGKELPRSFAGPATLDASPGAPIAFSMWDHNVTGSTPPMMLTRWRITSRELSKGTQAVWEVDATPGQP